MRTSKLCQTAFLVALLLATLIVNLARPLSVAAEPEPWRIGVIIPQTGDWKVWGDRIRDGLELYRNDHLDTLPLELYYQDEGTCDPQKAFAGYQFLRERYGIRHFVVGCMSGTEAIAPRAHTDGALLMSAGFQQQRVFEQKSLLVNFALQIDSEASLLADTIKNDRIRRLGVVRNHGVDDFISRMQTSFSGSQTTLVRDESLDTSEKVEEPRENRPSNRGNRGRDSDQGGVKKTFRPNEKRGDSGKPPENGGRKLSLQGAKRDIGGKSKKTSRN